MQWFSSIRRRRRVLLHVSLVSQLGLTCHASADLVFTDQTLSAGVSTMHIPASALETSWLNVSTLISGATVGDFNNDGYQDILFLSGGVLPDRLFINNANGTFSDRALEWGAGVTHMGAGAAVGDYNNDGWPDVYITSFGTTSVTTGQHRLYRNMGGSFFSNVAAAAGVNMTSNQVPDGFSAAFGDYDLDGDLDLYVAGWVLISNSNRLFRNNGNGTFTDVTVAAGVDHQTVRAFTPRFADMDGDGYPELLVAADFGTSRYYVNQRDGTFSNYTFESGTGLDDNGMGHAIGDFDNDGRFEWYVTSIYSKASGFVHIPGTGNMLYYNQGDHRYEEISTECNVNDGAWGWGTVAADFNNDGRLDIAETNGWNFPNGYGQYEWLNHPSFLYVNLGDLQFEDRAVASGFNHTLAGRALMNLDYNNDGRQDLLVTSYTGPLKLYRNDTPMDGANWLRVLLDTSAHPHLAPFGVGSVLRATVGEVTQSRMICGGSNYLSQSELAAHFGFGEAISVDALRIEWNNGVITTIENVPTNQTITVVAGPLGDLNGDGTVNVLDLLALVGAWGECQDVESRCPADLDRDGFVDVFDMLTLLGGWK